MNQVPRSWKIVSAVLLVALSQSCVACDEGETEYRDHVRPTGTRIVYMPYSDGNLLSVVGTLENDSVYDVKSVVVEVQYFNKDKELIDSATDSDYSIVVPAHSKATFRVDTQAAHPESAYQSHAVVINSATAIKPPKKGGKYKSIALSWGPFVLIMLLWFWFARRNSRSKSGKTYAQIMEENTAVSEASAKNIARIADSLEAIARAGKP